MLTKDDLNRLNSLRNEGKLYTNVFLNVNPATNPKGEYFVSFRNLMKQESDKLSSSDQKIVHEDAKKIEAYIKAGKTEFKKAIAIFSSSQTDLWEVYHLAVPVKNQVVIDHTPYIKPIAGILEQYHSYAVAIVDREHARIFRIQLGEISEYAELFTPDIPRKHKKGGWQGRNENRFRRHIDVHVHFHLLDVVRHLEEILHTGEVNHLILGGSEESVLLFNKMLPQPINAKIAGTFNADMHAGNDEILGMSMNIIREAGKTSETGLIDELVTRASKDGSAAVGLENVLNQMQVGNIHHLIYMEGFNASGFKCSSCNMLTIQNIQKCPYCGSELEKIDHLIDFTIQRAIDKGANISSVIMNSKLKEAGNIGALLRY